MFHNFFPQGSPIGAGHKCGGSSQEVQEAVFADSPRQEPGQPGARRTRIRRTEKGVGGGEICEILRFTRFLKFEILFLCVRVVYPGFFLFEV